MTRISPGGRARAALPALLLGAASLLAACASDPGEKVADAPFPDLAEAPARPQASMTAGERAALRAQLENRREEMNRTAEALLHGGTDPAPAALDSRLPAPPATAPAPPPPLPEGLPPPPRRPAAALDDGAKKGKAAGEAEKGEAEDQ